MSALALSLKLSAVKTLSAVQRAINILKSAGPGAWYDPSDLTTLYQDSAGTTPVTAVEQPVGLMLDKSKGLVLGSELVTNRDFSNGNTGWVRSGPSWSGLTGAMVNDGTNVVGAQCQQNSIIATGKTYRIEFDLTRTSGTLNVWLNGSQLVQAGIATSGRKTFTVASTVSGNFMVEASAGAVLSIDNISVREIPGNHLIQPTATSRPTLSSRYNLLTKTEAFDDVYWAKGSASVTANSATAPDGTNTADSLVEAAATAATYIARTAAGLPVTADTFVFSLYVKANGRNQVGLSLYGGGINKYITAVYDLSAGTVSKTQAGSSGTITSTSITASGSGWYRIVMSGNTAAPAQIQAYVYPTNSTTPTIDQYGTPLAYTGDGTSGIYIWGASLVPASDAALPYQRVNTATDYDFDFSKFPAYLKFDGVDDGMYTSAIDFTSTDKMTVFAGVHKASDAATAALVELSANALSTNGAFVLGAPFGTGTATYDQYVRGTAVSGVALGSTPAPTTNVITAVGDIAGDLNRVTKNGTTSNQIGGDLGTGNFGNHVLNVGRRNNATLPFNGRLYQLALKGKALSAAEISTVEALINSRTKAF